MRLTNSFIFFSLPWFRAIIDTCIIVYISKGTDEPADVEILESTFFINIAFIFRKIWYIKIWEREVDIALEIMARVITIFIHHSVHKSCCECYNHCLKIERGPFFITKMAWYMVDTMQYVRGLTTDWSQVFLFTWCA